MKIFDTSKIQRDRIFHIQDRDRGFVFIGRVRFYGLDFIQFDVLPHDAPPSCKTRGMYTFDIGSKFILHGVKWDDKRNGYVYDESIIASEYLEKDEEKNNMAKEEKNITELLPCVVSDGTWKVNDFVSEGDHIYRIFNDKIDIKANMTINFLRYGMISLHLMDVDIYIPDIEIDESLRVCQTSSENDPGTLVMKQKLNFNKALRSGGLYRVIDRSLNFRYLMYIRYFNKGYIDADIMKLTTDGEDHGKIKIEHKQLSIIDLKDMMFNQIYFTEGCHLKLE